MSENHYNVHPHYQQVEIPNEEIWKDIPGYEGLYQVSTHGRVKSLARFKKIRNGGLQPLPEKMVALVPGHEGHLFAGLWKDNKQKLWHVGRWVLLTFVGPCPEGCVCCHYPDQSVNNNRLENLFWGTYLDNQLHRRENGTDCSGEDHWSRRINKEVVQEIRNSEGTYKEIAKKFGILEITARRIKTRKSWKNLPEKKKVARECFIPNL